MTPQHTGVADGGWSPLCLHAELGRSLSQVACLVGSGPQTEPGPPDPNPGLPLPPQLLPCKAGPHHLPWSFEYSVTLTHLPSSLLCPPGQELVNQPQGCLCPAPNRTVPKEKRADFTSLLQQGHGDSLHPFPVLLQRGSLSSPPTPPPPLQPCSPEALKPCSPEALKPSRALTPAQPTAPATQLHTQQPCMLTHAAWGSPPLREQFDFSWSPLGGVAPGLAVPAGTGRTGAERAPCFSDKGLGTRPRLSESWLCHRTTWAKSCSASRWPCQPRFAYL